MVLFKNRTGRLIKESALAYLYFAFTMYIIIYGLHNIGLTALLVQSIEPYVSQSIAHAASIMGIATSVLSNLFNNHPALMISTLTLTEMSIDPLTVKSFIWLILSAVISDHCFCRSGH